MRIFGYIIGYLYLCIAFYAVRAQRRGKWQLNAMLPPGGC